MDRRRDNQEVSIKVIKPIFFEMVHFMSNTRQFYDRSRVLPVWYEDPRAANPPVYQLKQIKEAEDKWFLQNNRTQSARLPEKRSPSSIGTVESTDIGRRWSGGSALHRKWSQVTRRSRHTNRLHKTKTGCTRKTCQKDSTGCSSNTSYLYSFKYKFQKKPPAVVATQVAVAASHASSDSALMKK